MREQQQSATNDNNTTDENINRFDIEMKATPNKLLHRSKQHKKKLSHRTGTIIINNRSNGAKHQTIQKNKEPTQQITEHKKSIRRTNPPTKTEKTKKHTHSISIPTMKVQYNVCTPAI